jgi:hypothetical protein
MNPEQQTEQSPGQGTEQPARRAQPWRRWAVAGAAVLTLALSAAAVYPAATQAAATAAPGMPGARGWAGDADQEARLAEALGITVEELQAAQTAARDAAIDQLVADGWLGERQAEQLREQEGAGLRELGRMGGLSEIDHDALLAEALGITPEALETARAEAYSAALAAAVEAGELTQEQADELQTRRTLLNFLGEQLEGAYESAVQQAVAEGVITQEQADELLNGGFGRGLGRGYGHGFGMGPGMGQGRGMHPGRGGMGGWERGRGMDFPNRFESTPDETIPQSDDSQLSLPQQLF